MMRVSVRAVVIKDNKLLVMDRDRFGDKFCSLVGGEVEKNEELTDALIREVKEEASLEITNPRLVIEEDAGKIYGLQYIYLCDYVSGELMLDPESIEAKISHQGKNTYRPRWLPISQLSTAKLLPHELKDLLLQFINSSFPDQPVRLSIAKDSEL